jgi:hypothetical protein
MDCYPGVLNRPGSAWRVEDLLVRYTDCERLPSASGESGRQFVQKASTPVPPPPDQPDTRGMDKDVADLAGS